MQILLPTGMVVWVLSVAAAFAYHPDAVPVFAITGIVLAIGCLLALRPVRDPHRAVIYRFVTLHRVSDPRIVFVLPLCERLQSTLDMSEHELAVDIG